MNRNTPEIRQIFGDEFASHRQRREDQIGLVQRGVLRREVFVTSAI